MVSGSVEGRTTVPKLRNDLNTVLTCFSPVSKDKELKKLEDCGVFDKASSPGYIIHIGKLDFDLSAKSEELL